jgi:hypothetical protein
MSAVRPHPARGAPPDQTAHVVGEVGQRDLRRGPSETDGADHQLEAAFLGGEHVLHLPGFCRASCGGGCAAASVCPWVALQLGFHPTPVKQLEVGSRAIGGIGPHATPEVVAVDLPSALGFQSAGTPLPVPPFLSRCADSVHLNLYRSKGMTL